MDTKNASLGWGRPRPKPSELLPATTQKNSENVDDCYDMSVDVVRANPIRVTPLIDYPLRGYDGAPNGELSQLYVNQGCDIKGLKNNYTTWDNGKKSPDTRFISIFTCPITGEHFLSGILPDKSDSAIISEIPWYKTKKLAVSAASAKALDCFSLRRCFGTEKTHWQRCLDSPYLSSEKAPTLPDLPPGILLPGPSLLSHSDQHGQDDIVHPKQALVQYYRFFYKSLETHGIYTDSPYGEMGPNNYCCWPNMKDSSNTLWTAIFTCHLSGERFPSGSLYGEEGAYQEDYWHFDPIRCMLIPREFCEADNHEHDFERVDFIWYKTKKGAINAAAARALDCLRHRYSSRTLSSSRHCRELPYTVDEIPDVWKRVSRYVSGVCDVDWPSLPLEDRLTTHFGVSDLHSLLEDEHNEEYWRARYKERRHGVGKDT